VSVLGLGQAPEGLLQALGRRQIRHLAFRSNVLPSLEIPDPMGPTAPNPFLASIAPTIVLDTTLGRQVIAPWGEATPGVGIAVAIGGVIGLAVLSFFAWRGFRKGRR
jgi:hypothetical protein